MDKKVEDQAIDVLIQVANLAQSKGVLSLQDAIVVANAINILRPAAKIEKENKDK